MKHSPRPDEKTIEKPKSNSHPSYEKMISGLVSTIHGSDQQSAREFHGELLDQFQGYDSAILNALPLRNELNQRGAIFLNDRGRIVEATEAALDQFDIMPGEKLSKILATREELDAQLSANSASLIFLINRQDQPVVMICVREKNATNEWLLVEADHGWPSGFSARLIASYDLSKRECLVLKQLCSGAGASDIAKAFNRKIGTIRQQIKSILVKLEVNSQAQAVALITSILVTIVGLNRANMATESTIERDTIKSARGNIGACRFGLAGGSPVLFFHGALFGIASHFRDGEMAKIIGLDIVAPHRPGYGKTHIGNNKQSVLQSSTQNAIEVLDYYKISQVVIFAHDIGCAYAFHFASQHPDRVSGLVCGPTTPPMHNWEQTRQMPARHRVNAWAAQKLPQIMDGMVSLGLAHIGKKGVDVVPEYVFADSDFDRKTWQSDQFADSISKSFELLQQQQGTGFKHDMHLTNDDWSDFAVNAKCSVTLFHGKNNRTVSEESVSGFANMLNTAQVKLLDDAGHTIALTHGDNLLREVARLSALAEG